MSKKTELLENALDLAIECIAERKGVSDKLLKSGEVRVIKTPVTERYCNVGDIVYLDMENKQIRCGGVWFTFNNKWIVSQEIV